MTVSASLRPHTPGPDNPRSRVGLALAITSSFGVYGHEWYSICSGPVDDIKAVAIRFLADQSCDQFLSKVLQDDFCEADFKASVTAFRTEASNLLETHGPDGETAQSMRESILEIEEAISDINEDFSDTHKIEILLGCAASGSFFLMPPMRLSALVPRRDGARLKHSIKNSGAPILR